MIIMQHPELAPGEIILKCEGNLGDRCTASTENKDTAGVVVCVAGDSW